jgi:peptidoglycan/LPS O-acetylase OafA/YrhL
MHLAKNDWRRLTAYRGLACFLVAFGHMVQVFVYPSETSIAPFTGLLAQASVMMFFVISGCSIAASVSRIIGGPNPVRRYALNRFGRILPPLIFSLSLMWFLSVISPYVFQTGTNLFVPLKGIVRDGFNFDPVAAIGALFFLNGFITDTPNSNGPLWSLSFEIWFYWIYFLLVFGVRYSKPVLVLVGVFIYSILVYLDKTASANYFLKYTVIWLAGVGLFFGLSIRWLLRKKYKIIIFCLMLVMLISTLCHAVLFILLDMNYEISYFNISFGLFFSAQMIFVKIKFPNLIYYILRKFADFGYTLYLIHVPIYLFAYGVLQKNIAGNILASWIGGVMVMMITIMVSFVMAKGLEQREWYLDFFNKKYI